jgi:hypothetical protein
MAGSVAAIAADAEVYRSKFDEIDTSGNGWCFYEALIKATTTPPNRMPPEYTGGVKSLALNLTYFAKASNLRKEVADGLTLGDLLKETAAAKSPPVTVDRYLENLRTTKGAAYSSGPIEWADGNIMGSLYTMLTNTPIRIYEAVPQKSVYRLKFKSADGLIDRSKPAKNPISLLFEETVDGAGHASGHYKWLKPKDIAPSRLAKSRNAMAKFGAAAGTSVLSKWATAKAAAAAAPGRIASGMKSAKRALAEAQKQLRGDGKSQVVVAGEIVVFDNSIDTKKHPEAVPFLGKYVLDQNKALLAVGVFTKMFKAGSGFNINDPLPPCNPDEKQLLMECLGTRLDTLRGDVIRMQADFGDSVRTRAGLERFLRLKILIDALDQNDDCQHYDTRLIVEIDPKDDARIKALLRQFAFLILQGRHPLPNWVEKSIGAKALVNALEKNPISEEDMMTYMGEYAALVEGGVPNSITNILNSTGAQSGFLETMVTAAQETLLNQVVDAIKKALEGELLNRFNDVVAALGSSVPPHQKILDVLGWLVEQYKVCMEKSSTAGQKISEFQAMVERLTASVKTLTAESEAAVAAQVKAEAALSFAEKSNGVLQMELEEQGNAAAAAAAAAMQREDAAKQQLATLQAELAAALAARGDPAELARVQAALREAGDKLAAAQTKNSQYEATIRTLQGQLDSTNAQVAANAAELERLRNAAPETAATAAEKAAQIASLEQQLAASQAAAANCEQALQAAKQAKATAEADAAQLRQDLVVSQATTQRAEQDAAAARARLDEANADFQALNARLDRLGQQLEAALRVKEAAAAAAAAAGQAATASHKAALQQATHDTERIAAELAEANNRASLCNNALVRSRAEKERANVAAATSAQQYRELLEKYGRLQGEHTQTQADAAAAQLRATSSSEADKKYMALISDLQDLSTAIYNDSEFQSKTGNENFNTILGLVNSLRGKADEGISKEKMICIFAHYVNFFMHAVFFQKGGAQSTYESIRRALDPIAAGLVQVNPLQKPSDVYYEILAALLPYVRSFEKVISMPEGSKLAGVDNFDVTGAPTVNREIFYERTIAAIKAVATTDTFTKRFGNDSMGLPNDSLGLSNKDGIVYAYIDAKESKPYIKFGYGNMDISTLITYDKILGIFLVASQLYLKELKPEKCLLPLAIKDPYAAFLNVRVKVPAQIGEMPVDPMERYGMSRGRQPPAAAPAVSPAVSPVVSPRAVSPAVSPRATTAQLGLSKLEQEAESDALTHGRSSFMISPEYRQRIAEYKRTHGL